MFIRLCRINSFTVICFAVGLILAAVGGLLVLADRLAPGETVPFRWFEGQLSDLDALAGAEQDWAYGGAALALILGSALVIGNFWLLLGGHTDRGGRDLIHAPTGRSIIVSRRQLEVALVQAACAVSGVVDATVSIYKGSDGLIDARARLSLNFPASRDSLQTIDEVEARIARAAREDFGVVIGRVDIASTMVEPQRMRA